MPTRDDILRRREQIIELAGRYGASDVRLFGSHARGDATPSSDVDLLVRFEPGRSLLDQGGLLMDLRELLDAEVDVVSEGALTGRFGQAVRREAVPL
jgi:predicted nucleotidyltransferase